MPVIRALLYMTLVPFGCYLVAAHAPILIAPLVLVAFAFADS